MVRLFALLYKGYSFVSPSVMFANNNIIGEECLAEDFGALVSVSSFFSKYKLDRSESGLLGKGSFSICREKYLEVTVEEIYYSLNHAPLMSRIRMT
ncbi:putative ribosomal protein [Dirofilaria immitis]